MAKSPHPYAAIEHRVIDSPAFADLSGSAVLLLLLLARQVTRNREWPNGNNGHLHAAFTWCNKFGIGSEHTLAKAIAELISHGFIYRTKSHGANQVCARYALTWLSITDRKGLFLDGFISCAWRNWQPPEKKDKKKSTPQKVQEPTGNKCSFTPGLPAESAGSTVAGSAGNELVTNTQDESLLSDRKHNGGDENLQPVKHRKRGKVQARVGEILEQIEAGVPKPEIADRLGIGITSVYRVAKGCVVAISDARG